jgi:hypothetical protein
MSFFNSLVNQMGRETGRDIYRSIKSSVNRSHSTSTSNNSALINELKNFELSAYDKVTYNRFLNLSEKFNNINGRSIDFVQAFDAMFNLISRLEKQLSDKYSFVDYINKLNLLIKTTAVEYIKYTQGTIDILKEARDNNTKMADVITDMNKNKVKKFIITALGFNSMFYDFGVQKIHTMFSLGWVFIAISLYTAGYQANTIGYVMGAIAHSMTFVMSAWLRPKAKEYRDNSTKIQESIDTLEQSIEIVEKLK